MNNTQKKPQYQVNATDDEIRAWMDAEIVRLGDLFKGFELTWHRNEFTYWVELWSQTKDPSRSLNEPHGCHFNVSEITDSYGFDVLGTIQNEGRKLYHRLRKDYPVVRDLGRK